MAVYQQGTVDLFKPEVWTGRFLSNLQNKLVYGDLANRDYEGEISAYGDTVHIPAMGVVTMADYTINGTVPTIEYAADTDTTLTITKARAFNIGVDDIDKVQSKPAIMEEFMKEAAYASANEVDQFIAGLHAEATAGAGLASALTTNKALIYDTFVANRQKFQENNVPVDELVAVIPPWMESLLLLDSRFISATAQGDAVLRSGVIGKMAGIEMRVSNNVAKTTTTTNHVLIYSGKKGVSLASQVAKVEAYRPQDGFRDAVKGLYLYGAKTIRPLFVLDAEFVMA
jgi:N4-gp56 family major capsid protein